MIRGRYKLSSRLAFLHAACHSHTQQDYVQRHPIAVQVTEALNAAALRRQKALKLSGVAPSPAPELLQKRKKEQVSKESQ